MPFPTTQDKYHGLVNQGATCYLNSVLQVLFMTEDFRERVKRVANAGTKYIDTELTKLFNNLEENYTHTHWITEKLRIQNVYEQRDAAEHYEKILRLTSPEASQIFHGELINRNECLECNTVTKNAARFWHLPLPLVNNNNEYSVDKGIDDFFRSSVITGDDQMYCEKCDKKCNAVLDCEVEHYPEVLVLLLKRFEMIYDGFTVRKVKNNCPVKIPDTLQHRKKTFNLYAFVDHFGDLRCGHYSAKIKSPDEGRWYIFDDLNVNESDYQHFQVDTTETSRNAYLLFYRQQKGDVSRTNIARPDTRETPLAAITSGTKYTRSSTEQEQEGENNTSAFSKDSRAKSVRPASKKGTTSEEMKLKVEHPDVHLHRHSNDELKEVKSVKHIMNKNHDPSQAVRNEKFQEDANVHDISNDSVFLNYTDTREETTERNKRERQGFDQNEYTKRKKTTVDMRENGSYKVASDFESARSPRLHTIIQCNQREQEDKAQMMHQSKSAGYQPRKVCPVKNKEEWQLGVSRQEDDQIHQTVNRQGPVWHSSRFALGQSSGLMYGNGSGHPHMSGPEHRMRSAERISVKSDHGVCDQWSPGGERINHIMSAGRHSFHGQHQKYRSQDCHLEIFRREMERNDGPTEKERRGAQNYNYKEKVDRWSQGGALYSHSSVEKPLLRPTPQQCLERVERKMTPTPQQCLERVEQKITRCSQLSSRESVQSDRSQGPKRGPVYDYNTGRGRDDHRSKAESTPQTDRSFRNHPYGHRKPDATITPDCFTEDVNNLTPNTRQETRECQALNKVREEVVLDTNDRKTKKRSFWKKWFCSCMPLRRKRSK